MSLFISRAAAVVSLTRFRDNKRGSAAVQFALVAPIFFALLFAIIETSLVFFAGQVLETGTQDSARLMLTHQAGDSNMTQAQFTTNLCNRVSVLLNCAGLYIDVKTYPEGTAITITSPIDNSGNFVNSFSYQAPDSGSKQTVVVRAFYQWPLYVTQLGYNIANIGRGGNNSKYLLAATSAFRVEPSAL